MPSFELAFGINIEVFDDTKILSQKLVTPIFKTALISTRKQNSPLKMYLKYLSLDFENHNNANLLLPISIPNTPYPNKSVMEIISYHTAHSHPG